MQMMKDEDLEIMIKDIEREQEEARKAKEAAQQTAIETELSR